MRAGPLTSSASRSMSGTWPSGSTPTSSRTSSASTRAGNTPNPCLRCNEKIKFAAVLDRAVALGFDAVCTGHHARLEPVPAAAGLTRLVRSVDPAKDQSYVLAVLTSEQLGRAMFPLGDTTKDQVRKEAADRGLAVADKPDSHDVCFIADGDTRGFLQRQLGSAPGEIVEADGTVVGTHDGSYGFTVGQRKGLRHRQAGRRRAAAVRAQHRAGLADGDRRPGGGARGAGDRGEQAGLVGLPAAGRRLSTAWSSCARMARSIRLSARLDGDVVRISLREPARGIAPGQAAVFYDGDAVLGSATIVRTRSAGSVR